MNEIDNFSTLLLEQAKQFLEKAKAAEDKVSETAYCHASLLLGFSSLEAHINALADELLLRSGLTILEQSILGEKDYILEKGIFELTNKLKMYRLEDRLLFLFANFSQTPQPNSFPWSGDLKNGIILRNRLVHPKDSLPLTIAETTKSLTAIIECLNTLYTAVFKKPHPSYKRKLDSSLNF